jgi:hypothetical protein
VSDQAIGKRLARLPDVVGAVDGLGIGGRVPPRNPCSHAEKTPRTPKIWLNFNSLAG